MTDLEPDYRFSLANERTLLAWVRTALALDVAGLGVIRFAPLLGWDADRQAREVAAYRAEVERDRAGLAAERATAP